MADRDPTYASVTSRGESQPQRHGTPTEEQPTKHRTGSPTHTATTTALMDINNFPQTIDDLITLIRVVARKEARKEAELIIKEKLDELKIVHQAERNQLSKQNDTILEEYNKLRESVGQSEENMTKKIKELDETAKTITVKQTQDEADVRARTVIIRGLPETANEKLPNTIKKLLNDTDAGIDCSHVTNGYRIGKQPDASKPQRRPRNVKLTLVSKLSRQCLFKLRDKTSKIEEYKHIRVLPDQTSDEMLASKTVQQLHSLAKRTEHITTTQMRGQNISLNGKLYRPKEFGALPEGISVRKASTYSHEWGVAFQGHNSPLSNFYACEIKGDDAKETVYNSVEQYYTATMALKHDMPNLHKQIMKTSNPFHLKAMGNQIQKSDIWKKECVKTLETMVTAKFTQNKELREFLLQQKGKLVEATLCPFWGCGLYLEKSDNAHKGINGYANNMGRLLERVRDKQQ